MQIYLDNAATTFKKPFSTYLELYKSLFIYNANPSRGSHKQSIKAGLKVYNCRERIKQFVNAYSYNSVIYTYNCTEAINYAILGSVKNNEHIVITTNEHNAVIRTLHSLKNKNITYSEAKPNSYGLITLKEIKEQVKSNTKLIIVNHTSNVTGATTNLTEIGKFCKENNILFLVDAAQSGGHEKLDIKRDNINFLCLAGHKGLYGIQGIGALILNGFNLSPIKFGGSGSNSESPNMPNFYPEKLEAGTVNLPGIMALDGGIKFIKKNFDKIQAKITKLSHILLNYLNNNKNIKLYSNNPKSGVISFNFLNKNTDEVINFLNQKNIFVRGGLHCAPLIHKHLNTTKTGIIRVSISYFNTVYEIKKLIAVLKKIAWKNQAIF